MSAIEWTDKTWNPVIGCTKISAGCAHCYAETMAKRLQAMGKADYSEGFAVKLLPHRLEEPLRWRKPRMIFVCSMSDLLHEDVPHHYILQVMETIRRCPQHQFQVLTKRPGRLRDITAHLGNMSSGIPENLWVGTSVENRKVMHGRISALLDAGRYSVRFLSLEPLLEDLGTIPRLDELDWVIVGGESGRTPRPMDANWVRSIRDQCIGHKVAFFFKQWGGVNKKKAGRELDGCIWNQMPPLPIPF